MIMVATNIQATIKTVRMIETLLQAALKVRKPKMFLSKTDLLKGN